MPGLWQNEDETRIPKYLVLRRDGTKPKAPAFVMLAADPYAPAALVAYAHEAARMGADHDYVDDVMELASEFNEYREMNTTGDPAASRHRTDHPIVIAIMNEQLTLDQIVGDGDVS